MKRGIHPKVYPEGRFPCSCGNVVVAMSTREETRVDSCSKCHPFYTGQLKAIDSGERIKRFKKKYGMK